MKIKDMKVGQKVLVYVPAGEYALTGADYDVGNTMYQDAHWHETVIKSINDDPNDQYATVERGWYEGSYHCDEIDPLDCLLAKEGTIVCKEQD
jgi:hypothetical protein